MSTSTIKSLPVLTAAVSGAALALVLLGAPRGAVAAVQEFLSFEGSDGVAQIGTDFVPTPDTGGYHHSMAFTLVGLRAEHGEAREGQCRSCHAELAHVMAAGSELTCVSCHEAVSDRR